MLLAVVVLVVGAVVAVPGTPANGQVDLPDGTFEATATVVNQRFEDGPNGTVFTITTVETADGRSYPIQTDGGIHSNGIAQVTSHQPEFRLGETYRIQLLESVDAKPGARARPRFSVAGGDEGALRVTADGFGIAERANDPTNFVLQDFSWDWTLPDNPPTFKVNANTPDVANELALIRQAFDVWEDDPGSAMDWTFDGTTTVNVVANDGTNAIFWADTPDPADDYLAQSTTFFNTANGNAVSTDIVFNNDFNWVDGAVAGSYDLLSIAIHEAGHSSGLDHAPNEAAIMYDTIADNTIKRTLSIGDRAGIATLYPAPLQDASVAGRVAFDDGTTVGGAKLNLFTENRGQFLGLALTDDNGEYRFTLPVAGCYVVTAIAPDGETFVDSGGRFLNTPFCAAAGEAVTGVDATLIVPGTAASSTGRVTTERGTPAANLKLNLFTENRAAFVGFAFTDANGDYSFTLPSPGCYVTTFIAPDGESFVVSGGRYQNAAYCAAAGETVTGIDAVLADASSQATFGGEITNPDGSGEEAVKAVLYRASGDGGRGQWIGPAFTDANGAYRFNQAAGCYVIDLIAPDGRTWAGNGGGFTQLSFCVTSGETNIDLDAALS